MSMPACRRTWLCGLFAATSLTVPAHAQTVPPPRFDAVDANGVDLVSGRFVFSLTEGSIGSGAGEVSLHRSEASDYGRTDQWSGRLYRRTVGGTALMYVEFGGISDTFTISGSTYTSTKANGGTLTDQGGGAFRYTASDGTVIDYVSSTSSDSTNTYVIKGNGCDPADVGTCAIPTSIARPDGTVFTLNWDIVEKCVGGYDSELNCLDPTAYFRFGGVTSSTSYSFSFTYATNTPGNFSAPQTNWYKRTGATFTNLVNTPASLPTVSYSYPSSTVTEITDTGGLTWRVTTSSGLITGIRRPGASSDTTSVSYSGGIVTAVTREGVTTSYSRSVSGTTGTMTVTDALSNVTTVVSDLSIGRPTSVTDALSRTTSFTYDTNGRLTQVTRPEGDYTHYSYDSRGNLTETRSVAKSGSGLPDIITSASFPSTCTVVACNRPTSTTDARGNTTDYTYDSTHGGVLTITGPAPTTNAVRPQSRFTYALTNGEYRVASVSACQTSSSCSGGSDEVKTTFAYDSNGNATSITKGDGTGALSATIAMTYDPIGNPLTIDEALSGSADTTRFRYNGSRQLIGVVSPDPDGGGSLKHRATRFTINGEGLTTKVERGTVNSQSDSDWSAFSALEAVETGYDSASRPITQKLTSGSTTYGLLQTSYDALGRQECVAQRMNPAEFTSLPSSACTLDTEGSFGPDRIVKTVYDAAGQITQTKTAYGTAAEANAVTTTYSNDGRIATITDAEGNKTTYEYDGHDRLLNIRFPSPTTDGASAPTSGSGADYEQLGYDENGNITSRRLRDGNSIGFTFDALDRLIGKNLPGTETDVTYSYDALSRLTGATQGTNSLSFTYDALSRNLTEAGPQGTVSSTWDSGGRRTKITHPDGFYVVQDYLVTGEMTGIRETNGAGGAVTSGAGVLATYAYDDLGRRISLTRGDGSVTSYSYDNVSRPSQLSDDLSGTTYDQTLGYSYNPASQVTGMTRSNDLYAWPDHYNVNRNYATNGLNQHTTAGSLTPTYDSRGNLTSAGSITYGFSSENLLATATGGISLGYDPAMRLYQTVGALTTRFAYDHDNMIAEFNASNVLQRRYVYGPRPDEPIAWYEGSDTTDRRFLHADQQGSVVAITSSSGSIIATNSYDEYGIPASTNVGRFQYTGQAWLSDLSMYYYKARIYSATLGRFLQTDPVGYGDGMNIYAYVKADPVNSTDPSGLGELEYCKRVPEGQKQPFVVSQIKVCITISQSPNYLTPNNGCFIPAGCFAPGLPPAPPPPPTDPHPDPRKDCNGKPLPPASRKYSIPPNYHANSDPNHQSVVDSRGRNVVNPYFQTEWNKVHVNKTGVAVDLATIAAMVALNALMEAAVVFSAGEQGSRFLTSADVVKDADEARGELGDECHR